MTFLYSLLLALDLGLPVDFLMFFSLHVRPDEPEIKLEAIWLFTWKWSFFNFPFAEKVSPSPSIPALQLRKYCNEWMKWGLYQILNCEKGQIFFWSNAEYILVLLKTEGAAPPTFKLQFVSQQLVCEYHHWSCVFSPNSPPKSLLVKPIMAQKQKNKQTELALLSFEDWHLFAKTKAKVFETGGQEGIYMKRRLHSEAILERPDTKDSFSKLAPVHSESVFELPIIDFLMCVLLWTWIILLVEMTL